MHRFCFISKRSDFQRTQNQNSQCSERSIISKKECIAMFPAQVLIETRRKRVDLMKNCVSLAFNETGSASDIYQNLPYQPVRNLHQHHSSVRSNKDTRSKFCCFFCSSFLFFFYFFFGCTFLIWILYLVKRKQKKI